MEGHAAGFALRWYHTSANQLWKTPGPLSPLTRLSSTKSSSFDQDLTDAKRIADEAFELYEKNMASTTDVERIKNVIADLETEQSQENFWDESNAARAASVNELLSQQMQLLSRIEKWNQWYGDCTAALEMLRPNERDLLDEAEQAMLLEELRDSSAKLLDDSKRFELELLLSGPYDGAPARIVLTAGAGGTEANDWVADLKRMYERHAQRMGYQCVVEDSQDGDVVGFKSVELLITGPNAFGWFQGEKGAHRLVRLSPFNANNKRQTTFAGVDVAPADILNPDELKDIEIPENELEITTMRAGGKGGQNVNKVNSAVRIKHLPSGLQVKCSQERTQSLNKGIAMKRLKAQLLAIATEQRVQEINEIRGDMVEASWGAQIRNYVLHPYKMVKDTRTGWETSNVQSVLDGDLLEDCIGAFLRYKAAQDVEDNE